MHKVWQELLDIKLLDNTWDHTGEGTLDMLSIAVNCELRSSELKFVHNIKLLIKSYWNFKKLSFLGHYRSGLHCKQLAASTIKENRKGEYIRSKRTRNFWTDRSRKLVFGSNELYGFKDCSWHKKSGSTGPVWQKSSKTVFKCAPCTPSLTLTHTISLYKMRGSESTCSTSMK